MPGPTNARQKKQASLSALILLVIIALVYVFLLKPAISGRIEVYNRYEDLKFSYLKTVNAAGNAKILEESTPAPPGQEIENTQLLNINNAALAAAELQNILKRITAANQALLISTQVLENTGDSSPGSSVSIKVHVQCDINSLRGILIALESNLPVLFTDNLLINTMRRSPTKNDEGTLDVRFDVSSYLQTHGSFR